MYHLIYWLLVLQISRETKIMYVKFHVLSISLALWIFECLWMSTVKAHFHSSGIFGMF